jgi:predicted metal-dependent hydrolase
MFGFLRLRTIRPKSLIPRRNRQGYLAYKEQARQIATERLAHFNQFYNFTYGRISIRSQKTRWGSCSKRGNLNFNYRIALLPPHLADYIIVHELCHIGQFNHSRDFWNLVAKADPEYKAHRAELKKYV